MRYCTLCAQAVTREPPAVAPADSCRTAATTARHCGPAKKAGCCCCCSFLWRSKHVALILVGCRRPGPRWGTGPLLTVRPRDMSQSTLRSNQYSHEPRMMPTANISIKLCTTMACIRAGLATKHASCSADEAKEGADARLRGGGSGNGACCCCCCCCRGGVGPRHVSRSNVRSVIHPTANHPEIEQLGKSQDI